jgi:hypothetical protein
MISYSEKARVGYARLYRPYNDIDVYVEDTTCRAMYEHFINRVLRGKARITRILQLGNRARVVAACTADQGNDKRPRLYIIDGDLERLRGKRPPRLKRLYRLRAYAFENLLLDEDAVVEVLRDSLSNLDKHAIRATLRFDELEAEAQGPLFRVFIVYSIIFNLNLPINTISYNVHRLASLDADRVPRVSQSLVRQRLRDLLLAIFQVHSRERYLRELRKVRKRISFRHLHGLSEVSGKSYILPLLHERCVRLGRYRDSPDSLRARLARYCRLNVDPGFRRALMAALD